MRKSETGWRSLPGPFSGEPNRIVEPPRSSTRARNMQSAAQPTCFLIADISGYTGYLASVELDHAEDILTDLLGVIITALRPNFRLSRIESDAAFMFSTVE